MIENLICKSIFNREEILIDRRFITLRMDFSSNNKEDSVYATEIVLKTFLEPFGKEFLLNIGTDDRNSVAQKSTRSVVLNCLEKKGYSGFYYDGILKGEKIKTKKDFNEWTYPSGLKPNLVDKKLTAEHMELQNSWIKKVKALQGKGDLNYICDNPKKIVEKIIELETTEEDYKTYVMDCDFGMIYDVSANPCQCHLDFSVYLYSLGDNVTKMTEYLWKFCEQVNEKFEKCKGYIALNYEKCLQYDSPAMNFFYDFPDGEVWNCEKKEYQLLQQWLEENYIEGIEWGNIIPTAAACRIRDMESLKRNANFSITEKKDGSVSIASSKSILDFGREDIESCYYNLKDCLRPGYSECPLDSFRSCGEKIYIPLDEYDVDNGKIYFKRGNFDFVTKLYPPQENIIYHEKTECEAKRKIRVVKKTQKK